MSSLELITIVIAVYGAIVATIVGINEINKGKKKLDVILQYEAFYETLKLIIVNSGYRPIIIENVHAMLFQVDEKKLYPIESVPQNSLFTRDEDYQKLPKSLKEGEQIDFMLHGALHEAFHDEKQSLSITVIDTLGKQYKLTQCQMYNPKLGGIQILKNQFTKRGKLSRKYRHYY